MDNAPLESVLDRNKRHLVMCNCPSIFPNHLPGEFGAILLAVAPAVAVACRIRFWNPENTRPSCPYEARNEDTRSSISGSRDIAASASLLAPAPPYAPLRPQVNFAETSKQLIEEQREHLPATVGRAQRYDYEYKRNGTRNLFLMGEPQAGWRHLAGTPRRTKVDFAHQVNWLVAERSPQAQMMRVVWANLNTHKSASLYEAVEPAEAQRMATKGEFHPTPKHGSWVNMAEIELSILQRPCLDRRIAEEEILQREVGIYEQRRIAVSVCSAWCGGVTIRDPYRPRIARRKASVGAQSDLGLRQAQHFSRSARRKVGMQ